MIDTADLKPKVMARFNCRTKVKFQIVGAQSIYLATTQQELTPTGPGAQIGGIQIQQANGIVELEWIGECWVLGSQANSQFVWVAPGFRENVGSSV